MHDRRKGDATRAPRVDEFAGASRNGRALRVALRHVHAFDAERAREPGPLGAGLRRAPVTEPKRRRRRVAMRCMLQRVGRGMRAACGGFSGGLVIGECVRRLGQIKEGVLRVKEKAMRY